MFRKPLKLGLIAILFVLLCSTASYGSDKIIKVGVFEVEPLSFRSADGTYDGLAINILEHVAQEEKLTIEYVPCSFSECLKLLESGDIDLQSVIAYTDERAQILDYTNETVFNDWSEVYTRSGIEVESVLDLAGKRIAILQSSIFYKPFIELTKSFDVEVIFIESNNYEDIFNLVQNNKADALVANRLFALRKARDYKVVKTPIIFSPIDIRYAALKGTNQELLDLLDKHLKEFKSDKGSLYYESIERLFGVERGERMPLWHYWVLYGSIGLIGLFMVISMIFRSQVRKRTLELRKELDERKRIEAEVFQGKRDWEETFDTITDIITIHDKDFTIIRANKAASQELKIPWDKINKAKCFEHYHGTACPPESCASCQSLKTGEPTTIEMFEPHMNKYIEIRAIPRKDKGGNIVGLIHVVRDITQRQNAYDALKASESKNRTLLENISQKIFYKNSNSVYVSCNRSFAADLGIGENEIEGKTDFDLFSRELAEKYRADDRRIIESGTTEEIEESYEIEGSKRVVFTTKSPVKDEDGNITGVLGVFQDITEQKQAEDKYRSLFGNIPLPVFVIDPRTTAILDVNNSAVQRYGYSRAEFLSMNAGDLRAPDDDSDAFANVMGAAHGDVQVLKGRRHQKKDGTIIDFEVISYGINFEGKSATLALVHDVTDSNKALDDMHKAQALLTAAIEQSPAGIIIAEAPDGMIRVVNSVALEIRGGKENILTNIPIAQHPENWQILRSDGTNMAPENLPLSQAILYGREARNVELIIKNDKGDNRHVLANAVPIKDSNDDIAAGIMILHDITERKLAEKALIESENKYRTLVDNSLVGIFRTNTDGDILFINDAMVNLLGYDSQEDIMQSNIIDIYERPEDRKELIEFFRQAGRVDDYELAGVKKDGEKVTFLVSSTLEGDIISGMLIDITERKRMERTAHLASIGELAAGVAHEINNPTNSIINYAQVMQDRLSPETKEGDYADRIIKEGNRIAGIVKGLLSFARGSGGKKTAINIDDVLKEALLLTRTHFKKNNIKIKLDISPGLPKVMANHQQIEQVFLNILSNAQYALIEKFPGMQEGKEILITCSRCEYNGNEYVKIIFHDNGAGMSQKNLSKVSAPFFTTKPTGKGTGLGLSISHGIISDHDGTLNIQSREGEFTKITLDLPVKD